MILLSLVLPDAALADEVRWTDANGDNVLTISRERWKDEGVQFGRMRAVHRIGAEKRLGAEFEMPGCSDDVILDLRGVVEVSDVDGDGDALPDAAMAAAPAPIRARAQARWAADFGSSSW